MGKVDISTSSNMFEEDEDEEEDAIDDEIENGRWRALGKVKWAEDRRCPQNNANIDDER